jgi:hypothetical protein
MEDRERERPREYDEAQIKLDLTLRDTDLAVSIL